MHFLLARNFVNPVNYISFLIFIPFAIRAVSNIYSGAAACWWLFSLFLLILFVIYINVYIKRQMVVKPVVSLGCGLALVLLVALDYFKIFSVSEISLSMFNAVLTQPLWALVPLLLAAGVYLLNYRFLITHSYPEEIDRTNKKKQASVQSFGFVSRFGQIGELIGLELKLILRHKRPKQLFYNALFALVLLGVMFYAFPIYNKNVLLKNFIGIAIVGFMMTNYGQLLVAWEGKFFDGIISRKISLYDYFKAKYYLLILLCFVGYILTLPYAFFGMRILLVQTAGFLYSIGVNTYIMLLLAQHNRKRIDLSQSVTNNTQGMSASRFFQGLLMTFPLFFLMIFSAFKLIDWGVGALAILGIIGLLCQKWIFQSIYRSFAKNIYKQAESFRSGS